MKTIAILIFVFVFLLALPLIAIMSKGEVVLTSDEAEAIALNYVSNINNGKFTDCEIIGTVNNCAFFIPKFTLVVPIRRIN